MHTLAPPAEAGQGQRLLTRTGRTSVIFSIALTVLCTSSRSYFSGRLRRRSISNVASCRERALLTQKTTVQSRAEALIAALQRPSSSQGGDAKRKCYTRQQGVGRSQDDC